jgi:hypothetical protein
MGERDRGRGGVGSTDGAGVTTGGSDDGADGSVGAEGSVGIEGAGDTGGADTFGWLGTGVVDPHPARTIAASSEAARTRRGMASISDSGG